MGVFNNISSGTAGANSMVRQRVDEIEIDVGVVEKKQIAYPLILLE